MADNLNFDDFDALVAKLASETGEPDKETTPEFKLHLGGKDYSFKTQADAERAIETQLANQREQLARAQTAAEAAAKPPEKEPEPLKPGEVPTATKQFVDALEKGNMEGAVNALFGSGVYGGKVDNAAALFREMTTKTALMDRSLAETSFLQRHEDLQKNPEQFQVVQQAREYLGLGNTADGLEAAYHYARGTGHLPAPQSESRPQGQNNRSAAPPSPSRTAATTGNGTPQSEQEWADFYRNLPQEKFNQLYTQATGRNFGSGM